MPLGFRVNVEKGGVFVDSVILLVQRFLGPTLESAA